MPVNFLQIQNKNLAQNAPLLQGVAQGAQQVGQAFSGKTLKSMFQDVIDAGGSPITAMQKIMPYDPDLADKLGTSEQKKRAQGTLKQMVQQYFPGLASQMREGDDPAVVLQTGIDMEQLNQSSMKNRIAMINALKPNPDKQAIKVTPSNKYPSGYAYTDVLTGTELAEAPKPTSLVTINQPKPASAAERQTIANARATRDLLSDLNTMFDESYVGPFEGRIGVVKDMFGANPQKQSQFYAATKTLTNKIIKLITGAQMSEKEATRIKGEIPQPTDPPTVWKAKYDQSLKNIDYLEKSTNEVLGQSGLKVLGGESQSKSASDMTDEQLEKALRGE